MTQALSVLGFLLETTVWSIMAAGCFPCRKENQDSHSDMVHSLSTKYNPAFLLIPRWSASVIWPHLAARKAKETYLSSLCAGLSLRNSGSNHGERRNGL